MENKEVNTEETIEVATEETTEETTEESGKSNVSNSSIVAIFSVMLLVLIALTWLYIGQKDSLNETVVSTLEETTSSLEESTDSIETTEDMKYIAETSKIVAEDVSSETGSAIMSDYSKEKAVLINIYNKLTEVYSSDEWVYLPENIGDDTLGFEMGIKRDMYKTFFCKKSLDEYTSDIFLGICAQDGKAEEVKNQLYNYKDKLTLKFESVPAQIERIQSADIVQHGDYVYFILLGKLDVTLSGEQVRAQTKQSNSKAVEIVSDDSNYENVDIDIKEDKRYQLEYATEYDIEIPEIKSKPQNIDDETEESITPEEQEQLELEEAHETSLSGEQSSID